MIMRDSRLTVLSRIRAAHPGWSVRQDGPRRWLATSPGREPVTARRLATLEQRLGDADSKTPRQP